MHLGQKTGPQPNQYGNVITMGKTKIKTKSRKYKARPQKPAYIIGKAAEFWKRFSGPYWQAQRLTPDTAPLFCQLCTAWGRWRDFSEMQSELIEANPAGRGLIFVDSTALKVSIPADKSEKAESHFFKLFEKFIDITERFSEPEKIVDTWGD